MRSCQSCSPLYVSSLPDAQNAQDYDSYYDAESFAVPAFIYQRLGEIVGEFASYWQTNCLLDIGCGAGSLLRAADSAGWNAEGVEISRTAAEHVRGEGFQVFRGELAEVKYPAGHFDVVTASEVLEHVPDPQVLVCEIARVLRPGGLFWATTPHGCGISSRALGLEWSNVNPPDHLQLFSRCGDVMLLNAAGFRQTRIMTHSANPFEIIAAWRHRLYHRSNGGSRETDACGRASSVSFDRVKSSCHLNEVLTKRPTTKMVKSMLNGLLAVSRLGDS